MLSGPSLGSTGLPWARRVAELGAAEQSRIQGLETGTIYPVQAVPDAPPHTHPLLDHESLSAPIDPSRPGCTDLGIIQTHTLILAFMTIKPAKTWLPLGS